MPAAKSRAELSEAKDRGYYSIGKAAELSGVTPKMIRHYESLELIPKAARTVGDYRVYFERHELGIVVRRILSRNTLKDFLYRSSLPVKEDEALQQNPKFWELIESAKPKAE